MTGPDSADSEEIPRELRRAMANEAAWAEPPGDLHDNALAALRAARTAAGPAVTPPVTPAGAPAEDHRAGTGRRPLWLLTAAVAAVIATGLAWTMVVDAPDSTLALSGTELAESASATVGITAKHSGFEVVLDVDDLAPAPKGTYYQAWFKDADGILVTIGTFHARASGEDIVLWSGVDPDDYDVLTVTLQRVGAGADSSGDVVLSGPLR